MELIVVLKETLKRVQGDVTIQKEFLIKFVLAGLLVRVRKKRRALNHHLPSNRLRMRMRGLNYHLPVILNLFQDLAGDGS